MVGLRTSAGRGAVLKWIGSKGWFVSYVGNATWFPTGKPEQKVSFNITSSPIRAEIYTSRAQEHVISLFEDVA